ncbi:MAG: citrate synthase [Bdellovibrionales bacterium]|nr:citrate synthase [Bdellovibrionales bacterium]
MSTPATPAPVKIYRDAIDKGLEGVVACSTKVSSIEVSTLCYRGYTIEDLAEHSTFEETIYLLWNDRLPSAAELESFSQTLRAEMSLPAGMIDTLRALMKVFPKHGHPMDFLRSAVSVLASFDSEANDMSLDATHRKALRLTAKMGTLVAGFARLRQGQEMIAPNPAKSLAWNFLHMLFGREPQAEHVKIFDTALILHADHELNCSAFSTRVTASSLSDLHSAIVSAIGTLKGPLHGGANEAVMKMLREIGSIEKAQSFVEQALIGKQKVMGIGHRVYKNGDPRAKILKSISQKLTREVGRPELYEMSVLIDQTMQDKKGLMPNVDFYSATVYDSMGIENDLFTPIFAVSRIAGWCAHAFEQYANNRIYRPRGEYQGQKNQSWRPVSAR